MKRTRSPRGLRLVVADGYEEFRLCLVYYLESRRGLAVVGEARDGVEAIRMTKKTHPDVVLLNMNLSVLDGITAAKAIKLRFPDIRVIVISFDDEIDLQSDPAIDAVLKKGEVVRRLPETIATIRSAIRKEQMAGVERMKLYARTAAA